jgi:hypothetical protein
MEFFKKSLGFLTPFKLKANLFKQAGTFAKYETFTAVNIESLIFGL